MKDAATLRALAERVEALSGPDREVDALIAATCRKGAEEWKWAEGYPAWEGRPDGRVYLERGGPSFAAPAYTASLDAAMTLVPEGWRWSIKGNASGSLPFFYVADMGGRGNNPHWKDHFSFPCATPALAITAAALRAHAAIAAA